MITAIILACSLEEPTQCTSFSSVALYPDEETCAQGFPAAVQYVSELGMFPLDYYCHNWGEEA